MSYLTYLSKPFMMVRYLPFFSLLRYSFYICPCMSFLFSSKCWKDYCFFFKILLPLIISDDKDELVLNFFYLFLFQLTFCFKSCLAFHEPVLILLTCLRSVWEDNSSSWNSLFERNFHTCFLKHFLNPSMSSLPLCRQ